MKTIAILGLLIIGCGGSVTETSSAEWYVNIGDMAPTCQGDMSTTLERTGSITNVTGSWLCAEEINECESVRASVGAFPCVLYHGDVTGTIERDGVTRLRLTIWESTTVNMVGIREPKFIAGTLNTGLPFSAELE